MKRSAFRLLKVNYHSKFAAYISVTILLYVLSTYLNKRCIFVKARYHTKHDLPMLSTTAASGFLGNGNIGIFHF
jgi:hypothetical protein